ncbi:hypothetical protein EYC84_009851 [Monilinia fructicola]|uniref:Anticodon-binding domain-containing protein n=1 Tax=Monilinia fructicola TaxID=38448 RepID=A0A5M9JBV9_MONFR|nr:hypothetical protein EYC84_009851 [Monilinia fructicola]
MILPSQLSKSSCSRNQSSLSTINDDRARLSKFWIPTGGIAANADEDSHAKLIRGGFLRQAHTGIFHMLPLGRRVQDKLEALIDKHMSTLGASKLALSSLSSEELWAKSGRLDASSELESIVMNYDQDKAFFVLETLSTYNDVRKAYKNLFDELKIPYLVAEADSGDIGGDLSHEFHFPTKIGEDNIISCSKCDYVANEELAETGVQGVNEVDGSNIEIQKANVVAGFSRDGSTLIASWFYSENGEGYELNARAIKAVFPEYDPSRKVENQELFRVLNQNDEIAINLHQAEQVSITRVVHLIDGRVPIKVSQAIEKDKFSVFAKAKGITRDDWLSKVENTSFIFRDSATGELLNLRRISEGDICPKCQEPELKIQRAIELGHTFHLGTRYSKPMGATVTVPSGLVESTTKDAESATRPGENGQVQVPMEMGCHGVGVTRMIGAVAETLADEKGLNWPRVMAPFEIVVIPGKGLGQDALQIYDTLSAATMDPVVDDREVSVAWKLRDADLIGYPVIVLLGRKWKDGLCEVQCRRLDVKEDVKVEDLKSFAEKLLSKL